jgi:hypothetical protein
VRNERDGKIYLKRGDFGIKKRKYLYAIDEFVKGNSIEDTAEAVSKKIKSRVTKTMIKETFRVNLFRELLAFAGDENRISFKKFCELNKVLISNLAILDSKVDQQRIILIIIYLREVFDLRHPLEIKK